MVKVLCDFGIIEDERFDLCKYNLSYDFIYDTVGLHALECYPVRGGFQIIDEHKCNYFLTKVSNENFKRYRHIHSILKSLKNKNVDILDIYSRYDGEYIFGDEYGEQYLIFELGSGVYKKHHEFNLFDVSNSIKNFYEASGNCTLDYDYINYFSDDMNEIDIINNHIKNLNKVDKIISLKYSKDCFDLNYDVSREIIFERLYFAKDFFSSEEYISFFGDPKNLKFIHGNLSNRSFIYQNNDCLLSNFLNSSMGLIIKDISILVINMEYNIDIVDLINFTRLLIPDFDINMRFYKRAILSYLNIYNSTFKLINGKYLCNVGSQNMVMTNEKLDEFKNYNTKLNDFVKNISFT